MKTGISGKVAQEGTTSGPACRNVDWIGQCVVDSSSRLLENYQSGMGEVTPILCIDSCASQNYSYAGVQYSGECWCGATPPPPSSLVPDSECNMDCNGDDTKVCGGSWRMNVYPAIRNDLCKVSAIEAGTDYPGMDLNLDTGRTTDRKAFAADCQALCTENPECNFFGWKESSKECWLKTGVSGKVAQEGTTSGPACRNDPCQVEVEEGTDYPGMDVNLETGRTTDMKDSAAECQALCTANPACNFFGWKAHSKECWMKTGISGKVAQEGTTSGPACRNAYWSGQCVVDSSSRLLGHLTNIGRVTPSLCVATCASQGYSFAGVQYSGECWCGATAPPPSSLAPDSECNMNCNGDGNKVCGGSWRMNVYTTVH